MFKGTPMQGKYDKVVETAKANNVPPSLMAGIIAHETGRGTSQMLSERNTPAGLMGKRGGLRFGSLDAGIEKAGESIAKNYIAGGGTIEGMQKSYASVGATNDPGGLNKGWAGGVAAMQGKLAGGDRQREASLGGAGTGEAGAQMGASEALAFARQHLGEHEIRNRSQLQSFFKSKGINIDPATTAWCAAFVNANLKSAGIKGTGSLAAGSFTNYGTAVAPGNIQPGDIGVVRGRSPRTGLEGKHVGLLTGESRMVNGRRQVEMLGGNQGEDNVNKKWYDEGSLHLRRAPAPVDRGPPDRGALDRRAMSRADGAKISGNVDVGVDFKNMPQGVTGTVQKRGDFVNTEQSTQRQMMNTPSGPSIGGSASPESFNI